MENKIKRFLELSKEFTVKSHEVYEGFEETYGNITINGGICYTSVGCTTTNGYQTPTKLEQFTKSQQEKIEKAQRYEEYLKLQSDLLEYYTAKEKLNN